MRLNVKLVQEYARLLLEASRLEWKIAEPYPQLDPWRTEAVLAARTSGKEG